jgi:hypothetical protein
MAYASKAGRARVSASRPRAFAVCDRCGIWFNHDKLRFQFDWAGTSLVNKRILVCGPCVDRPQEQLRAIILPADPMPILNPRPEQPIEAYTDYRFTDSAATDKHRHGIAIPQGARRTTQNDEPRVTQTTGDTFVGESRVTGLTDTSGERVTEDGRPRIREWRRS